MSSKYVPFLLLACVPLARADVSAPVTAAVQAPGVASKSSELDAITADVVAKFNAQAPASAYDALLARVGKLGFASMRGMSQEPEALRAYSLQQFIAGLQDYMLNKDKSPESANNSLQQLAAMSATLPVIPRSVLLGMIVKPENGRSAQEKKSNDDLALLTANVVAAIDAAKVPSDLDRAFAEISQLSSNRNDYNFNSNKTQNLKYFVQNWQDYLAAVRDGKFDAARNDLHGLENPNYDASFYPRSKIIAALEALPAAPPPAMLSLDRPETITLDNLDEVIGQLEALRNNPAFQAMGESGVEGALLGIKTAYAQVKDGRGKEVLNGPAQNYSSFGGLGRFAEAITNLWLQVRLQAAPDAIGAPATAPKPTSKDTMAGYLERSLVNAIAAKDWALAIRVLKVQQMTFATSTDASEDLVGIRALVVGGNHESAGQWDQAVAVYTSALNSTGPHLPVNELSSRLQNIQKLHPDDYAAGLKLPDPAVQRMNAYRGQPAMPNGSMNLPPGQGFQNGQFPNR